MIAPSGMMDGVITTLRKALDKEGFEKFAYNGVFY